MQCFLADGKLCDEVKRNIVNLEGDFNRPPFHNMKGKQKNDP